MKTNTNAARDILTIFVFGSNLAGIHGAGAAEFAQKHHGAKRGYGIGLHGTSYAIPTKNQYLNTLPLFQVERYIHDFIRFAEAHPEIRFKVTQIGCGLAGFNSEEIAPVFRGAPTNCAFDSAWKQYLGGEKDYWGTFPDNRRKDATKR